MNTQRLLAACLAAAALMFPGCRTRPAPAPAAPARPVRAFVPPPAIVPALVVLREPDEIETQPPVSVLPPPPLPPALSRVPPPPRSVRRRPPAVAAKPEPEETAPEVPAEPAPEIRLGEVLPGEVARSLEQQFARDSAAASQVLDRIRGRRLSREQADLAARIRAFLQQAQQLRSRDLSAAAGLARRAALLAGELNRTLR